MTRFSNHPDADSTPNDVAPPDKLYSSTYEPIEEEEMEKMMEMRLDDEIPF